MGSGNMTAAAALPPYVSLASLPDPSAMAAAAGSMPPDDNVGPALLITSSVLLALALSTTAVRLLVRTRNRLSGWDDHTMAATAACAAARFGCQVAQVRHGNGRHRVYLAEADYRASNMFGWAAQLLLFAGLCLLKLSICLLLLRIQKNSDGGRRLRRLMCAIVAGLVATNGAVIIILLAECHPIQAYWAADGASCWDPRVRIYSVFFTIAYTILTDLLCSLLPLLVVWNVRMPLKSKLLVCGLMSLGLLATGFGIGRAVALSDISNDLTWIYCFADIWANCELLLGITAANLALSRSIYVYFFSSESAGSDHSDRFEPRQPSSSKSHSSSGYHLQAKLRCERVERPMTTIEGGRRLPQPPLPSLIVRGSLRRHNHNRSVDYENDDNDDTIPISPGIQKKTEFWLTEDLTREDTSSSQQQSSSAAAEASMA